MPASARARSSAARPTRRGSSSAASAAIALTHEHGDHACGAPRLARRLGVPVLTAAGTWDRLAAGMRRRATHRPSASARRVELGPVPGRGLSHQPRCRRAAGPRGANGRRHRRRRGLRSGPADGRRALSAARTSRRSCSRRTTTRCCSGPAATRRWCSAGSRARAATCPTGRRPSCWPSCIIPGSAVVVLAHLSQRCNIGRRRARRGRAGAPAGRVRGELHVAAQDAPLAPIDVVMRGMVQLRLAL